MAIDYALHEALDTAMEHRAKLRGVMERAKSVSMRAEHDYKAAQESYWDANQKVADAQAALTLAKNAQHGNFESLDVPET